MTIPSRKVSPPLMAALLVAGCTGGGAPVATPAARPALPSAGIDRVIGKDARELQALFGVPDQDLRDPGVRRLQYAGPVCVLDAYLYAPAPGREPVVRHVDARLPGGEDVDRASCIAALSRRPQAR